AFNEYGDLFTADNDSDHGDEERLVHVVENGDSGWRVGYQYAPLGRAGAWNTEKLWHPRHAGQAAYLLPPIVNIEDGPSGITYYPGTGLSPEYRGSLFVTHYKGGSLPRSGIFTYKLKPQGASYAIGDAKLFLGFALPTDVKFGPDGRVYFTDWADHWSRTYRGRIYAIADKAHVKDPLTLETQQLIGGDWKKRSPAELSQLLGHADWRVRLEAQFELVERGAASIPVFASVARGNGNAFARRHAIWGLGQLANKQPEALAPVRSVLADGDSEVRAQALKTLGDHRSQADATAMIAALEDTDNRVKFFAAQSLGKLEPTATRAELAARATPALFSALRTNNDRDHYLRHALVMGLVGNRDVSGLVAAIGDTSPAGRLGAVLALRRLQSPEVARFLADAMPHIAREAALAINDAPIPAAYAALAALIDQPVADEPIFLRVINAHFRLGQPANAEALARFAARADAPPKARAEALAQLGLWGKPPQRDRIVGVYRPHAVATRDRAVAVRALEPHLPALLAPDTPAPVQTAALKTLQDLEIAGAADALFAAVRSGDQPAATRASALEALDKIKDPRLGDAVKVAAASSSSVIRLAALPIAARLSPDAAVPVLENLVLQGAPAEQRTAFGTLGNLKHPAADRILSDQLRALAAGKIAPAVQLDLVMAAGRRSDPSVKALLAERDASLA
ncbi:MAG TPA: HEAT repeat domain-containing protein, partial [Opitutaceae bacterium]|nr:HEAT repeat domain-containing protein [Opitutaceae bacterium]